MSNELENEFTKKLTVRAVEEKEYDGKKTKYLIYERVIEERIKLDEDFKEKLEPGKTYSFEIVRNKYTNKETKEKFKTYKIMGIDK